MAPIAAHRRGRGGRCFAAVLLLGCASEDAVATSVLDFPKLCPNQTFMYGRNWPTRAFASDCMLVARENPARAGAQDINLVVLSPYSGGAGDVITQTEPAMLRAVREIEDSTLLPGFRLRFYLADSMCDARGATAAVIRAFSLPPQKHGLIGDTCSAACQWSNAAAMFYNVLQSSPLCSAPALSVRSDYPFFIRTSPTNTYGVQAGHQVIKLLQWHRVALLRASDSYNTGNAQSFLDLVQADVAAKAYAWTLLLAQAVDTASDARSTMALVRQRDARVLVLFAYDYVGSLLFCEAFRQGMLAPDYVFVLGFASWSQNFMVEQQAFTGCSPSQFYRAAYGTLAFGPADVDISPGLRHSLSGQSLADIYAAYNAECSTFADGQGACATIKALTVYDTLWEYAAVLHQFLTKEARPFSTLNTPAGRQRLYEIGLSMDFQGATGRVRHFNGVDPATSLNAGSYGDRQGSCAVRQILAMPPNSLMEVGVWRSSSDGALVSPTWKADLKWSPLNSSLRVPCASGLCDFAAGWVPRDRSGMCPPGAIWRDELGCEPCSSGSFGAPGATDCTACGVGTFANGTGASSCALCAPGTASPQLAAVRCRICDRGAYVERPGSSECAYCPRGTFSDADGATACTACQATFTTSDLASRRDTDCTCGAGTFLYGDNGTCVLCPWGFVCPFGSNAANLPGSIEALPKEGAPALFPQVRVGFYTTFDKPFSLYSCESDLICPGGPPESCPPNHKGLACGRCVDSYYRPPKGVCRRCQQRDVLPIVGTVLVGAAVVIALLVYSLVDSRDQRLTFVTAVLAVGQAVCAVQTLGVMAQLQLRWAEPIATLVKVGNVLAFDFDLLKIQCVLGRDNPVHNFLLRLFAPTAVAALLALLSQLCAWGAAARARRRWWRARLDLLSYANSVGLFMVLTYIPVTITMLRPLQCTANPNKLRSMASDRAVLCWVSGEHDSLVVQSITGLLCFPIALLARVCLVTWRYPVLVAAGRGPQLVAGHRFLFARFRPERYYWGALLLVRNLALALVPVVFPDSGIWQLTVLSAILLIFFTGNAVLWPWRTPWANASELGCTMGLVSFMQVASFFVVADVDVARVSVASLLFAIFLVAVGASFLVVASAAYRFFRPRVSYTIFLSHHKTGAGSLARWFKIRILLTRVCNVFLDSDELEELDILVDTVGSCTKNMVVLLTRMTLMRPWCAAEIATASRCNVNMVQVVCCDFVAPTPQAMRELGSLWTQEQMHCLSQYGIVMDVIITGYERLLAAPAVGFQRFESMADQHAAVHVVLHKCGLVASTTYAASPPAPTPARIAVTGAAGDAEVRSTCEIAAYLLQLQLHVSVAAVHTKEDAELHKPPPAFVVVVLTRGLLADEAFVKILLTFCPLRAPANQIVPIVADPSFAFPSSDYFHNLDAGGEEDSHLASVLRRVVNVIAMPFSPHASSSLMEAQIRELAQRRFKNCWQSTDVRGRRPPGSTVGPELRDHHGDGGDQRGGDE